MLLKNAFLCWCIMIVVTSVISHSIWECDYRYGGGCSQREFVSKCRAKVLYRWWLAYHLNERQLNGCPDLLWYLKPELGLKAICICSCMGRRVLGAHFKYVYLVLSTSSVYSLAARWSCSLKCYSHSPFTKCYFYLS